VLPRPPLVSITSVSYVDTTAHTQTWAATSGLSAREAAGPKAQYAWIVPAYAIVLYPITRYQPEAVTIEYVCGYGAASAVPDSIKHRDAAADRALVREPGSRGPDGRAASNTVPLAVAMRCSAATRGALLDADRLFGSASRFNR
jgi:hypothetical protein